MRVPAGNTATLDMLVAGLVPDANYVNVHSVAVKANPTRVWAAAERVASNFWLGGVATVPLAAASLVRGERARLRGEPLPRAARRRAHAPLERYARAVSDGGGRWHLPRRGVGVPRPLRRGRVAPDQTPCRIGGTIAATVGSVAFPAALRPFCNTGALRPSGADHRSVSGHEVPFGGGFRRKFAARLPVPAGGGKEMAAPLRRGTHPAPNGERGGAGEHDRPRNDPTDGSA